MHVDGSFACDQQHCSPCSLYVSCWDGSLTCTGIVSSMSACGAHCCSCHWCNSLDCLCSFMFFLSWCFSTWNSFFSPSSTFMWSSCLVVASSAWSCNLAPPLCCQQPSYCIHCVRCILYDAFSYCSWCCSLWWCCLMSLSMNNLMSSWLGKLIDTWSTASPSVLWMVSSSLLSWKPL